MGSRMLFHMGIWPVPYYGFHPRGLVLGSFGGLKGEAEVVVVWARTWKWPLLT